MLTILQPSKHVLKDTPVARLFRRKLKFDDIVTFWNAETGEWVLGYWIEKRRHLVEEMEDLGMAFEKVTPEFVEMIVTCWKSVNWKAKKERLISKEKDRVRTEVDKIQDEQSKWNWAAKRLESKGLRPIPYAFNAPISGGQVV